jgi:ABC-type transport system involved in multi-copper enzyme maturation permease subunit
MSKRTLVVLFFCLIPLILSVAWASGWQPGNRVYEEEIPEELREDRENGVKVKFSRAEMDFRDDGDDVVIERFMEGTSSYEDDPESGVQRLRLEANVNLNVGEDGDDWTTYGNLEGVTIMSADLAGLPADVVEDLMESLNNTPLETMMYLLNATVDSLEALASGMGVDIYQLAEEAGEMFGRRGGEDETTRADGNETAENGTDDGSYIASNDTGGDGLPDDGGVYHPPGEGDDGENGTGGGGGDDGNVTGEEDGYDGYDDGDGYDGETDGGDGYDGETDGGDGYDGGTDGGDGGMGDLSGLLGDGFELPEGIDMGDIEAALQLLSQGIFEYPPELWTFPGSENLMFFGTGPGGLTDWSTWRCYAFQRINGTIIDSLNEMGLDIVADQIDRAPLQVKRGEVRGYVTARAWATIPGPELPPGGGSEDGEGGGGYYENGYNGDGDYYLEQEYNNAWAEIEFPEPDPDDEFGFDIFQSVIGGLYLFLIIPITALLYATVAITDEVTNRTMTYMTSRPVHRYELYMYRFAGYLAATLIITLVPLLLTFFAFGSKSGDYSGHTNLLATFILINFLYVLILGAIFFLFCSLTNHPLILGLIYVFFWEDLMSQAPLYIRYFTVNFYMRSIGDEMLGDSSLIWVYKPVVLFDAFLALIAVFAALMVLGMMVFAEREYH